MMNRVMRRGVLNRVIRRGVAAAFLVVALSVAVAAQQRRGDAPDGRTGAAAARARRAAAASQTPGAANAQTNSAATNSQSSADESFELNIGERRITERDFFASTAIEAGETSARGLSLRVGVAVGASEIDVLLRNVRGRVRFRGSLEALRRVLDARRAAAAAAAPDVP